MSFCSRSESSASLLSVSDRIVTDSQKLFASSRSFGRPFGRRFGSGRAMAGSSIVFRHRSHSSLQAILEGDIVRVNFWLCSFARLLGRPVLFQSLRASLGVFPCLRVFIRALRHRHKLERVSNQVDRAALLAFTISVGIGLETAVE